MKRPIILIVLLLLAVLVAAAAPFVERGDMRHVPLGTLWDRTDAVAWQILWEVRIPRVAMGMLAGAGLALSGMAFQAVFRNALATPFTLGVASGASLGACVYIHLTYLCGPLAFTLLWVPGRAWFALGGAVLSIVLVYGLTRTRRGFSTATLLLAGVAINFFFSSLILLFQYLSDFTQAMVMLRWLMGSLDQVSGSDVLTVLPLVSAGAMIVLYLTHELNLIATGDELAASRGVEVNRTKVVLFFAVSVIVGAIVALCGPIGFVGLMAPHICRLLIGPDHRALTPATLLFGAAFLTACDTVARTAMFPTELPVGIITSLLGGPFFLWLLLRRGSWE
jgi:iron complex transport system permease protein